MPLTSSPPSSFLSGTFGATAALLVGLALVGCGRGEPPAADPPGAEPDAPGPAAGPGSIAPFEEVADELGLRFVHTNGMTGELYFNEIMGSGVALFDYDGDGDLDVYLVQGHSLGEPEPEPPSDRLFRNDLETRPDGTRVLGFTDVTEESGIRATGYGMGAQAFDYDGDGRVDLYVTNFGPNQLWRNEGDGTFTEVAARSGVDDPRWSVPAVPFDFDRDGHLDLFVGNYVDFTLATHKRCTTDLGEPNYCGPLSFQPYPDSLYRNRGDGRFEEVSARLGLRTELGGALGAVAADFDGDGWLDLYVANDGVPNQMWMNQRGRGFRDEAQLAGSGVNRAGRAEASMGVDAGDFDGDGDEDLFMTHLTGETNALFVNQGDALFDDRSLESGLGLPSWEFTGFGTAWLDYDNDGHLDVLAVNGAVRVIETLARAGDPFPLHQTNQLFRNRGDGTFAEVTAEAGAPFAVSEVSRGAAFGDLDNDGDVDVVFSNNNGPARLLRNRVGNRRPWVGLRLVHGDLPRDALGAGCTLELAGEAVAWRRVRTAASYASSNDPRLLFGLGPGPAGDRSYGALVAWPDGLRERFSGLKTGAYAVLRRGTGEPVAGPDRP